VHSLVGEVWTDLRLEKVKGPLRDCAVSPDLQLPSNAQPSATFVPFHRLAGTPVRRLPSTGRNERVQAPTRVVQELRRMLFGLYKK